MKYLFFILLTISLLCASSCSSSNNSASRSSGKKNNNSEISSVEMEGGEILNVYGYSDDGEVSRKMKLLEIDFIDCYKQIMKIGKAENINIDFSLTIDDEGFFETIDFPKAKSKNAAKIARCIKKEMEVIGVRPGSPREADFRLTYKIIKEKPKKSSKHAKMNELRSKTIESLSKMKKFRECYDSRKTKNPNLKGRFSLKFNVSFDGEVYDIKLKNNTFTDKYVINCVVEKLEDTTFPKGDSDDEVEINFDFTATYDNPRPEKPRKSLSL